EQTWELSDFEDWATLYIPESKVYLWIRDKAGHESNKLPIIRLEPSDFLEDKSLYPNLIISEFKVQP
ncbi:unnamed protein product, partial [marine sediment metagenome]